MGAAAAVSPLHLHVAHQSVGRAVSSFVVCLLVEKLTSPVSQFLTLHLSLPLSFFLVLVFHFRFLSYCLSLPLLFPPCSAFCLAYCPSVYLLSDSSSFRLSHFSHCRCFLAVFLTVISPGHVSLRIPLKGKSVHTTIAYFSHSLQHISLS